MHARHAARADVAKWLLATQALLLTLGGCSAHNGLAPLAPVGVGVAVMALRGGPSDSGRLTARLSDGRVLEGTWSKVTQRALPEAVVVETPRGLVSAAELAAPDYPAMTGTLGGPRERMICAFVGDVHSGYWSLCADREGSEWIGAHRNHTALASGSGFCSQIALRLHERR